MSFKVCKQVHSWPLGTVNGHGQGHVWLAVPNFQLFASFSKIKMESFCSRPKSDRKKIRGRCFSCREENQISKGYQIFFPYSINIKKGLI